MTEFYMDAYGRVNKTTISCAACKGTGKVKRKTCAECVGVGFTCEAGDFTPEERAELDTKDFGTTFTDTTIIDPNANTDPTV
jgi:RecJ-like exonuclease